MPVTWMIISGTFLIPFDSVNQQYLENAHSAGELLIQVHILTVCLK
jgi:hypothetical protein